jgi:hypothetical protein
LTVFTLYEIFSIIFKTTKRKIADKNIAVYASAYGSINCLKFLHQQHIDLSKKVRQLRDTPLYPLSETERRSRCEAILHEELAYSELFCSEVLHVEGKSLDGELEQADAQHKVTKFLETHKIKLHG